MAEHLAQHDIVVSCTAARCPSSAWAWSNGRSRSAAIARCSWSTWPCRATSRKRSAGLDDVFLYTVDDLAQVVESGLESRQAAVVEAEDIIANRVRDFLGWLESRDTVPVIRSLRDSAERMRRHEMEHALKLLAKGENPEKVLDHLSHRLTNKFLHAPTQTLNQPMATSAASCSTPLPGCFICIPATK